MRAKKRIAELPIGRTAMLELQMDALRSECCEAASILTKERNVDEEELDECARLDDALASAQRILKGAVARITLARLSRRSNRSGPEI